MPDLRNRKSVREARREYVKHRTQAGSLSKVRMNALGIVSYLTRSRVASHEQIPLVFLLTAELGGPRRQTDTRCTNLE